MPKVETTKEAMPNKPLKSALKKSERSRRQNRTLWQKPWACLYQIGRIPILKPWAPRETWKSWLKKGQIQILVEAAGMWALVGLRMRHEVLSRTKWTVSKAMLNDRIKSCSMR